MARSDTDISLLRTATGRDRASIVWRTVGAARTGLQTGAELISMADSGALHGDEAVAPSIVLTTELNARAVGADASDAFTIETGLALWTNDWSVDATQAAIATVVGAGIAVVAAYRCPRANTTGAYLGAGTGVAIVTGSALVGWTGIARSISRIAETHVARVILFRAVDRTAHACAGGIAGVRFGAQIAVIAGNARLRNGNAGSGIAGADVALVGERAALGIEAAIVVDEIAMIGDMLVQRAGADGDDVIRVRR